MRRLFLILILLLPCAVSLAQTYTISGTVVNKRTKTPVEFATVVAVECEQWAVADDKGRFTIKKVPAGKNTISVSCLGFVTDTKTIIISKDLTGYKALLSEDNLSLEGVVVTAKENENSATTSRTMDRTALDLVQMVSLSDIGGLLPGGVTANPSLLSTNRFNLRAGEATEAGNSSFGTAVEVDGVRISNNASFSEIKGASINNIASSNVESVEVISGVPSVEYGDIGAGIVKVNTKKGLAPYLVTMTTNPKTKQFSVSKGFGLGQSRNGVSGGVLNANVEYTRSVKDSRSPYESYNRKQISLNYSNLFNNGMFSETPIRFSFGITGNLGGSDTKADPDLLIGTYEKQKDNTLRANVEMNWLLSKPWITNLEFKGSVVRSNKLSETRNRYSSAAGTVALHGKEEGYFVAEDYSANPDAAAIMIPRGYWYNTMFLDDKPFSYKLTLKGNWAKKFGKVNNKIKLGADWNADANLGKGEHSEDLSNAPTYRTYDYSEIPFMNNLALFAEENVSIPIGKESHLNLIAGLRAENTFIKGSEYGTTTSLSPRFNAKYSVFSAKGRRGKFVQSLAFRASWGVAVKQPSFSILYPQPNYRDIQIFNPPTADDGNAYYAYYIMPATIEYNPDLVWQRNHQGELGMEINLAGTRISLAGYWNKTAKAFSMNKAYEAFTYNYTDQKALQSCTIPVNDRVYSIDRKTGVVTVSDKTGTFGPQTITGVTRESLTPHTYAANSGTPINRYGLEWVIDFKRINPINTDIRLDGNYYAYRTVNQDLLAYSPTTIRMTDNTPYKYIGWYVGGNKTNNGSESRTLRMNVTVTTHIPRVRMIISAKLEGSLLKYSRALSETDGGVRTYAVDDDSSYLPSEDPSFMDRRVKTVTYPEYYSSYWDPTPKPFLKDFIWARDNDRELYDNLCKLVERTSFNYAFQKDYLSPFFSANFSVTKEVGDIASISFYANNFFRNMGQVYSTKSQQYISVTGGTLIPAFYYGLTLRLKF